MVLIRQATPQDADAVSSILLEAARWLEQAAMPMWRAGELVAERIKADVDAGLLFVAECDGEVAGTVKFQLEDSVFWPDVPLEKSAFIHRLAVKRKFAGGGVSSALLRWAIGRTASLGRTFLRLDCEASRPRLRAVYQRFGFRHHSDRQVGPYFVSRYEYDVQGGARGQNCPRLVHQRKQDTGPKMTAPSRIAQVSLADGPDGGEADA